MEERLWDMTKVARASDLCLFFGQFALFSLSFAVLETSVFLTVDFLVILFFLISNTKEVSST